MKDRDPTRQLETSQKLGAGALGAAGRLGLKELAQLLPATKDSIQPIEEIGAVGNPPQGEIMEQRRNKEIELQR